LFDCGGLFVGDDGLRGLRLGGFGDRRGRRRRCLDVWWGCRWLAGHENGLDPREELSHPARSTSRVPHVSPRFNAEQEFEVRGIEASGPTNADNAGAGAIRRRHACGGEAAANSTRSSASGFRWRERFMFAGKTRWPVMWAVVGALLLSACTQGSTGTQAPTPGASASANAAPQVLRMARNAEPFSPFVPWQIDDNPTLFISVNV